MILQLALLAVLQQQAPPAPPAASYLFFVASEGSDEVALMRFGPKGFLVEHRTPIKLVPGDPATAGEQFTQRYAGLDADSVSGVHRSFALSSAHGLPDEMLASGPRGLAISRDGRSYFVTTARGFPLGELLKVGIAPDSGFRIQFHRTARFDTVGTRIDTIYGPQIPDTIRLGQPRDTVLGREPMSGTPAAIQLTPDGAFAWVTNASARRSGEWRPAWVSVVYLKSMVEAAQIPTCEDGGRAGRFSPDAARFYSLCNATDALVEIDAAVMKPARQLTLADSARRRCAPGAIAQTADGSRLFVTCRALNAVVEVDPVRWSVTRRIAVGPNPGELAVTSDGRTLVVVSNEHQSVSLIDLANSPVAQDARAQSAVIGRDGRFAYVATVQPGNAPRLDVFDVASAVGAAVILPSPTERHAAALGMRLAASRGAPADVLISPDDRYAFVSTARPDGAPGSIVAIDLAARRVAASIDFGRRLAGLAFWKSEGGAPGN